jgi:hypothetical protein
MPTIRKFPTIIFTHNKEELDKTKIENEHDVQRMLYSLIRPIFPDARLEVVDAAGYASVRYDMNCNRGEMYKGKHDGT